jgi:hypothetical protein
MKLTATRTPIRLNNDEGFIIEPPSSMTVDMKIDRPVVLYLADGTPLVRKAGF